MGRRIHASVIASPAVVTKVRKVENVASREIPKFFYRRKDGAIALAITAGVTNCELTLSLFE
jgi:hypothetical protein